MRPFIVLALAAAGSCAASWSAQPVLSSRTPLRSATLMKAAAASPAEECDLESERSVCAYDRTEIDKRFNSRPLEVSGRVTAIALAAAKIKLADDGGATLRAELSRLGPVFCKLGQTMATRPDIVGLETSRNLGQLQDAMAPEPKPATAMATLRDALGGADAVDAAFSHISAEPVAAASLAEVYRATTTDGREVAVKIQRPGLERKVALDMYVLRRMLDLAGAGGLEAADSVLDEVGTGLFRELDFSVEAQHIRRCGCRRAPRRA